MKLAKIFLRTLIFTFLPFFAFAQLITSPRGGPDTYGHNWITSQAAGTTIAYQWQDALSGTRINLPDNEASGSISIGFDFNYYGTDYSAVYISSGGFLSFSALDSAFEARNDSGIPDTLNPDNVVAVAWDTLTFKTGGVSNVYYQIQGNAPYRRFVIQWHNVQYGPGAQSNESLNFEIVLYETTNQIVFNYGVMEGDASERRLQTAAIGIENSTGADGLEFKDQTTGEAVSSSFSILWYGDQVNSATASISPVTVLRAASSQEFTYRVTGISSSVSPLGKADHLVITNPFTSQTLTVLSIQVDGEDYFIQRSQTRPNSTGYATWYYYPTGDSLVINTNFFAIRDSIIVRFIENIPDQLGSGNDFTSNLDAGLDTDNPVAASNDGYSVTVNPGPVSYYTVTPASYSTSAGSTVSVIVQAYDAANNLVTTDNSTLVDFLTTGTRVRFNSTQGTLSAGQATFTFADSAAEQITFSARSNTDTTVSGTSSFITVQPGAADSLANVQGNGSVIAGTDQLLRSLVTDQYNNVVNNESIRYRVLSGGGNLGGLGVRLVNSGANGIAETPLTTGVVSGTNQVAAVIVSSPADSVVFTVTGTPGGISYYTVTPATYSALAGTNISVTVRAYDGNNNLVSSDNSTIVQLIGSTGTVIETPASQSLTAGVATFQVSDNVAEGFTLTAQSQSDPTRQGMSGVVMISPNSLDYIRIRTAANNGGREFGDSTMTVTSTIMLYTAGYDQYANYRSDVTANWTGSGLLNSVSGSDLTYTFSPVTAPDDGRIVATSPVIGVDPDSTGIITIQRGALAELRIQTRRASGQAFDDTTLTTNQTLTLYSVGYDLYGNYLGTINANWAISSPIGQFLTGNLLDSMVFDATTVGAGLIRAISVPNPAILDYTGLITVGGGTVSEIIIRDAPNGGGTEFATANIVVGSNLHFYSAGYDANANYISDQNVNWRTAGTISGLTDSTDTSNLDIFPIIPGTGYIYTTNSSGWINDSTGTIVVQPGNLRRLAIRTGPSGSGIELDTLTRVAGDSINVYAAGYDLEDNYLGDQRVIWSTDGDSIGYFANSDSTTFNRFHFTTVNYATFRVSRPGFGDISGLIKVNPANPDSIRIVGGGFIQTGSANSFVSDPPRIQVIDRFDNPVPGITVNWVTPSSSGELIPPVNQTDNSGYAGSNWRLRSSLGADTAYAIVSSIPDTARFLAMVGSSAADSLILVSGNNQTGTVANPLVQAFVVRVVDSLGNPVSGVTIAFGVQSLPAGGGDFLLNPIQTQTNTSGIAQTIFTLGSKVGNYTVLAANNSLDPGQVLFQSTATAGSPDTIMIYAGNQQTGVAGTQLALPVQIHLLDRYQNPVPGANVTWTSTSDGDTNNAVNITNSGGFAQSNWILRTQAGNDSLYASSPGVGPVFFTATVTPATATNITSVGGNNRTTFAGSGRILQAEVRDQYNNLMSNQPVGFLPVNRVSNPVTNSDISGIAQTVYTSPADADSSFARAYIAGANDTSTFNVYTVRYASNSLNPKVSLPGDTVTFYANFSNPGQDVVTLNPAGTYLSFSDGINTTVAYLDSPLFMPPRSASVSLKFMNGIISDDFTMGNYTPGFTFSATSGGGAINGSLNATPAELSIEPLVIRSVTVLGLPGNIISQGDTIPNITMVVQNNSSYLVQNINTPLVFTPDEGFILIPSPINPASIPAKSQANFVYSVVIPSGAAIGNISVDGYVSGNLAVNGNFIYQNAAITANSFTIVHAAQLALVGYSPVTVSSGQLTTFEVTVRNTGDATVLLNQLQSSLTFGTQTFLLNGDQAITAGSNTVLRFNPANISLSSGTFAGILLLAGTENGSDFRDTLTTVPGNELTVQSPTSLTVASIVLGDINASQGEQNQSVAVRIRNTGLAAARISNASSIVFDYNSQYVLTPSGIIFPVNINGGDSILINYTVNIADNASAGTDTFRVVLTYQDLNSGSIYIANNPAIYDTWTVLSRAVLDILSLSAATTTVSQGQTDLTVQMQIANTGQVAAVIGTADSVGLRFLYNNNLVTLTSPIPPSIVAPLSSLSFNFTVTINPFAATGVDSIRGFVIGRNQRTGALTTDVSSYLDSWIVQSPPRIEITSIRNSYNQVNRGQQNLMVEMQIRNLGQATAQMDTAGLYGLPAGSIIDSIQVASLRSSLPGGERDTILYNVDVSNLVSGDSVRVDGFVQYRDGNNLVASYLDSGAVTPKVWQVGNQAALVIDSVFTATTTMTLGQIGVMVNAQVGNDGDAPVRLDSLRMTFDNLINHPILSAQLLTPNIPYILNAGQRTTAQFRVNAASAPIDSGYITLNLNAYGIDQITGAAVSIQGSIQSDSILLQTPANVRVFAIINPGAVRQGQNNLSTTVYIRNFGQALARVNSTELELRNGNTFYNRELINPVLPIILNSGEQDTLSYEVDILSNTPLGTDSLRGRINYSELNRNLDRSSTSGFLSSWQVFGSGGINILTVQSDLDTVSTGQDSILVNVRVANSGNNSVVIDSIRLNTIRGSYVPSTVLLQPGTVLDSAATTVYQFLVQLNPASPSGAEIINAAVYGRDTFTDAPVSDIGADTTAAWLIQQAVTIVSGTLTPTRISRDQVIQPVLSLQNTGQAALNLDTSLTRLQTAGQSFRILNFTTIPGNSAPVLQFNTSGMTAAAGIYPYTLRLVGHENNSSYDRTYVLGDSLRIQTPAAGVVQSLIAGTDTVTQNLDTTITINVRNTGQAQLVIDTIRTVPYGTPLAVSPILPYAITGGQTQNFNLRVRVPNNAPAGNTTISSTVYGYDVNSNQRIQDISGSVTDNWIVLTQPNVTVDSVYSVLTVVQGQNNVLVNMRVVNNGQTGVIINSLNLVNRVGLYTQRRPQLPVILNGNSTRVFVDTISVATNSATGIDTLRAQISYTNRITGATSGFISTSRWTWQIQSVSNLEITSVNTVPQFVSRNQTGIPVTVRLRNQGGTSIRVDSLLLIFANGNSNYVISQPLPVLPLLLNSGATQNFNFQVSVQPAALLGVETIDARVRALEVPTSSVINITGGVTTDSWTVQARPGVVLESTTITPDVASTGQTGLVTSLTVVNQSGATARIDSIDLNMLIGAVNADNNFVITRRSTPSLPLTLAAGQRTVIDYNVSVNAGAAITDYNVDGFVSYLDINDNQRFNITTASSRDILHVQNIASLNILNFTITPDTVSWNQDSLLAVIRYRNQGASPARVENVSLTFNVSDSRFQRYLLDNVSTPFVLPGNSSDTLRFYVIVPNGILGSVSATASVSGIDINSGNLLSASSQDNIFLQTPVDPVWVRTQPNIFSDDTTFQFTTWFYNYGQSSIDLDSNQTSIKIVGSDSTIFLSGNSNQTLIGTDTTLLTFREKRIQLQGEYQALVTLSGSSNGSTYFQEFEAGPLTIGGQISFAAAGVSPRDALQGQQNVSVIMEIQNNGAELTIDSLGTTLIFEDQNTPPNGLLVPVLSRVDTLKVLRTFPYKNELHFLFDVPQDFPLGLINIKGQISLDGGSIVRISNGAITNFRVLSGARVSYITNTVSPVNVVPRQEVPFTVTLYDSGTASLSIIKELSYLEFGFSTPLRTYPKANFVLLELDSSQIEFQPLMIPADVGTDSMCSLSMRVVGIQTGGDTLRETLDLDQISVMVPATVTVTGYNINPVTVRQGQKDIQVDYTLQNSGQSDARVRELKPEFRRVRDDLDVSGNWVPSSLTPTLPDVLPAGTNRTFTAKYVLDAQADTGKIVLRPDLFYNDLRTLAWEDTFRFTGTPDSVLVVLPAQLRIDSLILVQDALAPNKPNVNINQPFNLRLFITNSGTDTAKNVTVDWVRNNILLNRIILPGNVTPQSQYIYSLRDSISMAGDFDYVARIVSAIDATTGQPIIIGQPENNTEPVHVDLPAVLSYQTTLTRLSGESDSTVAVGQRFYVRLNVTSSGTATFTPGSLRLNVPANYQVLSSPDTSYTFTNRSVSWLVQSLAPSQVNYDTLTVTLLASSIDQNSGTDAAIGTFNNQVLVNATSPVITINSSQFTSPFTNDSLTVSTDQDSIRIDARLTFHPLLDLDRQVKIELPAGLGYTTQDTSLIRQLLDVQPDSYDLSWNIRASKDFAEWSPVILTASAKIASDPTLSPVSITTMLYIRTVTRANIVVSAVIVEPAGALDGIVSEGQQFRIRADISKTGQANIVQGSQGLISIQPDTSLFELCSTCLDNSTQKSYTVGDTVSWWIDVKIPALNKTGSATMGEILSKLEATSSVSAAEEKTKSASIEQEKLLNDLSLVLKQQELIQAVGSINITLDSTPLDENSLLPANKSLSQISLSVTTENRGVISIAGRNRPDTVSAGQTFTYIRNFEFSDNVNNAVASIILPNGLSASNPVQNIPPGTKTLTWAITAADSFQSASDKHYSILAWATDNNSGVTVQSTPVIDTLRVEPYARVRLVSEIISPETAKNGLVSVGQSIQVQTRVERDLAGMAEVEGSCTVEISLPPGFTLTLGGTSRTYPSVDVSTDTFSILAPPDPVFAKTISMILTAVPIDRNSSKPAFVSATNSQSTFSISTQKKQLQVTNLSDSLIQDQSFRRGDINAPLLAFEISNAGFTGAENSVFIDSLTLQFIAASNEDVLNNSTLVNMLQSLYVVNYSRFQELQHAAKPPEDFATVSIDEATINPLSIAFTTDYEIVAGDKDTVMVLATFKPSATNRSFRTALIGLKAYDVNPAIGLDIIDEQGRDIEEIGGFVSEPVTIIPSNPKESFRNYPNPFGRDEEETTIILYLEQDANVELRIFTLTGGLVWTKKMDNLARGLHDGDIKWDGKNDRGKTVLNGVYLCQVQIKPVGNGSAQTYITKIAYLK